MFLIVYINDMTEGVSSYTSLFADDAKLLRKIGLQGATELYKQENKT